MAGTSSTRLSGPVWHSRLARGFVLTLLLSGSIGFVEEIAPWIYEASPLFGRLSWFILAGLLYVYLIRIFKGNQRATGIALTRPHPGSRPGALDRAGGDAVWLLRLVLFRSPRRLPDSAWTIRQCFTASRSRPSDGCWHTSAS